MRVRRGCYRRSTVGAQAMVDAIAMGCIPVLPQKSVEHVWQEHWGDWIYNASVIVSNTGSRVWIGARALPGNWSTLTEPLRAISPTEIANMQHTLARYAHRVQYHAVDTAALRVAMLEAQTRWREADRPRSAAVDAPWWSAEGDAFDVAIERAWRLAAGPQRTKMTSACTAQKRSLASLTGGRPWRPHAAL